MKKTDKTVRQIIDWFRQNDPGHGDPKAQKERVRVWNLFLADHGDKPLSECRRFHLLEWINAQGNLAAWTRLRFRNTICRPFIAAVDLGYIASSPFRGLRMPQGKNGRDMSDDEFRAALRFASPEMKKALIFLRHSGARPGEMRTATYMDVDLANAVITLQEHKTARRTGRPRRIILSSVLVKLCAQLVANAKQRHALGGPPNLFLNAYGNKWKINTLCKNFRYVRELAGLPKDCKLYGCRHALATAGILAGDATATIAALLGHSGLSSVGRYCHVSGKSDHLKEAVERAAGLAPPRTPKPVPPPSKPKPQSLLQSIGEVIPPPNHNFNFRADYGS